MTELIMLSAHSHSQNRPMIPALNQQSISRNDNEKLLAMSVSQRDSRNLQNFDPQSNNHVEHIEEDHLNEQEYVEDHMGLLNDLSHNCKYLGEQYDFRHELGKQLLQFTKRVTLGESKHNSGQVRASCLDVYLPDSLGRVFWDLFVMIFIFEQIVLLPVDLSFQVTSPVLDMMNYIVTCIFALDMAVSFNTAFQYKGEYVTDRKRIAMNYFKFWFWVDLGSSFPFDIIIDAFTVNTPSSNNNQQGVSIGIKILRVLKFFRFIKVMRLLRVLKLRKIFGKLEDYISMSQAMISVYEVFKLTFMMLFVAHWIACIWHYIGDQETSSGSNSWLDFDNLYEKPWISRYIASVYWATATMTTVGYGDITPITSIEKIFGIVVMLLACCIFAYIMNSLGGIFVNMDQNEKMVRQKMAQANQFLKSNDIPKELQARVRKYLEYKYEKESSQIDEKQALNILSTSLRDEVLAEVNIRLIREAKLFTTKYSKPVLIQLPFLLEEQIFGPEENIFKDSDQDHEAQGHDDNRCIFFITKGKVLLCIPKTLTHLAVLEKGQTFGEVGFFSSLPRTASAYTLDFVYVHKLKKGEFLNVIRQHDEQNQQYLKDKHQIELQRDFQNLNQKCFGCGSINHYAIHCPKLHYVPNQTELQEMIEEHALKELRFMKKFKRLEKVRYNARTCIALTQEVAHEIEFVFNKTNLVKDDLLPPVQELNLQLKTATNLKLPFIPHVVEEEDEFEKVKQFRTYFPNGNVDSILPKINRKAERRISELKTRPLTDLILATSQKNYKKIKLRYPRSSSAERSQYFEKLVSGFNSPDEFLSKLYD